MICDTCKSKEKCSFFFYGHISLDQSIKDMLDLNWSLKHIIEYLHMFQLIRHNQLKRCYCYIEKEGTI